MTLQIPPFSTSDRVSSNYRGFSWWGWHDAYPYWSRSCWDGPTEEEARQSIKNPLACKMRLYHLVLVHSSDDGHEVLDTREPSTIEDWNTWTEYDEEVWFKLLDEQVQAMRRKRDIQP